MLVILARYMRVWKLQLAPGVNQLRAGVILIVLFISFIRLRFANCVYAQALRAGEINFFLISFGVRG